MELRFASKSPYSQFFVLSVKLFLFSACIFLCLLCAKQCSRAKVSDFFFFPVKDQVGCILDFVGQMVLSQTLLSAFVAPKQS